MSEFLSKEAIEQLFQTQVNNIVEIGHTTAKERILKLKQLEKAIIHHQDNIVKALEDDFAKPQIETLLSEVAIVLSEIRFVCKKLNSWMKPKRIKRFLTIPTLSGNLEYRPKGACLIISPWNYPFSLAIGPLVYSIAAGNTSIIKPSELTPNTSNCIELILKETFAEKDVAVVQGDAEVAQHLTALPFNHIFFTGSPQVGRYVMEAASKHLTSVTLELGGKSPAIVTPTANLELTAKRLVWGKRFNGGQTCIAPDYLLVHESKKDELILALKKATELALSKQEYQGSTFCKIINTKHTERLKIMLDDATQKGAKIELGGQIDIANRHVDLTVLSNVSDDMICLNQEIFGPILPIKTYSTMKDALNYVLQRPRPLASYLFTANKKDVQLYSETIRTGAILQNDVLLHFGHPHAPFGGVNNSGLGNSNGFYGFKSFSHEQPVLKNTSLSPIDLLHPPYSNFHRRVMDIVLKWL